jgi:hypothetical protein
VELGRAPTLFEIQNECEREKNSKCKRHKVDDYEIKGELNLIIRHYKYIVFLKSLSR